VCNLYRKALLTFIIASGRITSLTTDTNNTMRKLWRLMRAGPMEPSGKILCVGCDSHGLQLLIKDIIRLPGIESTFKKASVIVTSLRNSPLLLSHFRRIQQATAMPACQLVQSVITRWGTQARMLESLVESRQSLIKFEAELSHQHQHQHQQFRALSNPCFWADLKGILSVLGPISTIQTASESDSHHVPYVLANWAAVLRRLRAFGSFAG
jgi:hypothetical protein